MTQIAGAAENHNDARLVVVPLLERMIQMSWIGGTVCSDVHRCHLPKELYSLTTACPPNWLRSAATSFSAKVPSAPLSARDRKRANSDIVIIGIETPLSIASCTIQRPSPESTTNPLMWRRPGSRCNASAVSSRSHDRTTLPCPQRLATLARSSRYSDLCIASKPSAYACISPYSIPLWTILT